jgi:hypothetical protein
MIQRRILMAVFAILLASPAIPGSAQTPASTIPDEEDLVGLQAAIWRDYAPAGTFIGEGEYPLNAATPASPVATPPSFGSLSVVVREFDTAEHAATAFGQISVGVEGSLPSEYREGKQEITSKMLSGVGSHATLIRMESTGGGSDVWLEYAIVQRDRYVFLVTAQGRAFSSDPASKDVVRTLPTEAIVSAIARDGQPSPDEPTFNEDGTSTGGLWGFMLPDDNPLLAGLTPIHDSIIYPALAS